MKIVASAIGVAAALGCATAFAHPDPSKGPICQAAIVVTAKSAENPDNRGLKNASLKLIANVLKHEQHDLEHPPKPHAADSEASLDRVDLSGRVERMDRTERPSVSPLVADRTLPAGLADR